TSVRRRRRSSTARTSPSTAGSTWHRRAGGRLDGTERQSPVSCGTATRARHEGKVPMSEPPRLIKKYPNRRLYDTKTSVYITLADVKKLVMGGEEFQVVDAKTGEDLTRSILLQIILEEEAAGAPMFSSDVLTQFIRSYGNAMQGMLGAYLERNMQLFGEIQKSMREQSQKLYGEPTKFNEELWKQFMSFQGPAMQ